LVGIFLLQDVLCVAQGLLQHSAGRGGLQPVPRGLYTGAVRLRWLPTGRKRTPPSVRLAIVFTILPYQYQF